MARINWVFINRVSQVLALLFVLSIGRISFGQTTYNIDGDASGSWHAVGSWNNGVCLIRQMPSRF